MSVRSTVLGAALLLAAAALVAGCGKFKKGPTQGEVYAAVASSVAAKAPDRDHDGLPDDVEDQFRAQLGCDPDRFDSDGDGVGDAVEIFGASWLYVRALGAGGALAADQPALRADDAAQPHPADGTDSDGDGVADWLEVAGFRFDWQRSAFVLDTGPDAFHTDPLQWSTDQDAYSDGMEVSGLNMDVAVRAPGTHPLVPAYPDVVVELQGYTVTLNDQITDGTGRVLETGTSWSSEVRSEHSNGSETGFGIETGFELGKESKFSFGVKFDQKWTSTDTYSQASTRGGSSSEQVSWERARSYSPVDAARLKLFVRVRNRGTAPASNLVPTISVRVGGADVATFEAGEVPVYMLLPGAAYPPDPAINLVLERDAAGNPLTLTDWELKALERGAPITLAVTQKRADVMRLDDGAWVRVGDVNEYLARIVSVSAGLFLDLGTLPVTGDPARLARRLVYARQGPTAPVVTLADALRWTDGFAFDPEAGYSLEYLRDDGSTTTVLLEGQGGADRTWRGQVDQATLAHSWPLGDGPASLEEVFGMELVPGSEVSLRAPRPPAQDTGPVVHVAYAVPTEAGFEIVVCASDYDAVAGVFFVDKDDRRLALARDGRGPWFFSRLVDDYTMSTSSDGTAVPEAIVVESLRTDAAGKPLATTAPLKVVYTPTAQAPVLRRVTYDNKAKRFYARIEPGGPLQVDEVDWVRLFHPDLKDGTAAGSPVGYRTLQPTIYAFEDPFGWEVSPVDFIPGMRLVAHTRGGRFTSRDVTDMQDLGAWRSGTVWLRGGSDWDVIGADEFWTPQADLDAEVPANDGCGTPLMGNFEWYLTQYPAWQACVAADPRVAIHWDDTGGFLTNAGATIWTWWPTVRAGLPDLYLRTEQVDTSRFVLGLHVEGMVVSDLGGLTAQAYYDALGAGDVLAKSSQFATGLHGQGGTAELVRQVGTGTVLLLRTAEGRLAKAIVRNVFDIDGYYDWYSYQRNVEIDYVVFRSSGDGEAPSGMAYTTPKAVYAAGKAIAPNRPIVAGGDAPDQFELCPAALGLRCWPADPSLLPAGLAFDERTGVLSGTPTAAYRRTALRVVAYNSAGSTSAPLELTVLDPPRDLVYTPQEIACGTGLRCTVAVEVKGDVAGFTIAPPLPAGLGLDPFTGLLVGRATEVRPEQAYLVTAANAAGSSTTATLLLATVVGRPSALAYPGAPLLLQATVPITADLMPTWEGGAITTWWAPGGLPAGLVLDPVTGRISGTPATATAEAVYTIHGQNEAGEVSVGVSITVTAPPPPSP